MKIKKQIKRFIYNFICLVLLVSTFTTCNENSQDSNNPSQDENNSTSQNDNNEKTLMDFSNLHFKEYSTTTYHEGGFYEVAFDSEGENSDGQSNVLIYFHDIQSMLSVPLCNKPDCTHNNANCNAYFKCPRSQETQPFIVHGKEKTYLVTEQIVEHRMTMT